MTVEKEQNGDTLIVKICGSVDANTADDLRSKLIDELDDVRLVHFHMKEMDYISSAGLRVILEVYQILEEKEGKLIIENVREEIRDIFELTGFPKYMEFRY